MSEFLSSSRNRAILGIAVIVIVVLAAGGGYYFWSKSGPATGGSHLASLSENGVCNAVVAQARAYGVRPPDAKKTGDKAVSDSDPNRVICNAQADTATFKLVADVPCDDAK